MWILLIKFQKYSLVYEVHLTESFKKLIKRQEYERVLSFGCPFG